MAAGTVGGSRGHSITSPEQLAIHVEKMNLGLYSDHTQKSTVIGLEIQM
jgi:hypothetical protein